jgi:hypothetical protein
MSLKADAVQTQKFIKKSGKIMDFSYNRVPGKLNTQMQLNYIIHEKKFLIPSCASVIA